MNLKNVSAYTTKSDNFTVQDNGKLHILSGFLLDLACFVAADLRIKPV